MASAIHPDRAAVGAPLLLPDGDAPFHLLDHEAAGLERLGAVRRRGGDRDARLARRNEAHAVPDSDAGFRPTALPLPHHPLPPPLHHLLLAPTPHRPPPPP